MTIHLPRDLENDIIAQVQSGLFVSVDAAMAEAARLLLEKLKEPHRNGAAPARPVPIWEIAGELRKTIPETEWEKLPADGAAQLDHYIYGSPKRPTA